MIEPQWAAIKPAPPGAAWRMTTLRHLAPAENRGKHHAYISAERNGSDVRGDNLAVRWGWEAMEGPPQVAFLNKPSNEPATNIPIQPGMVVWLEISDLSGVPSDRVIGLRTDYPDEPLPPDGLGGNTLYHHSFEVRFSFDAVGGAAPGDLLTGLTEIREQLGQMINRVDALIQVAGGL